MSIFNDVLHAIERFFAAVKSNPAQLLAEAPALIQSAVDVGAHDLTTVETTANAAVSHIQAVVKQATSVDLPAEVAQLAVAGVTKLLTAGAAKSVAEGSK